MLRAAIFDVDGVLVDSYHAHYESWRDLAAEEGIAFPESRFRQTFGRTSREIVAAVWPDGGMLGDDAIEALDARKEARFRDRVSADYPAMPGAAETMRALAADGVRLAVGSSGPPENVDLALRSLGIESLIDAVVTGRDVARGKPDPEVFEAAATRLGEPPSRAVVVEDAPDGVRAAHAAGCACVALLSTGRSREQFEDPDARPERFVGAFREIDRDLLERAWRRRHARG